MDIGRGNPHPLVRNVATSKLFLFCYFFLPFPVTVSRVKRSNGALLAKRMDLGVGDQFQWRKNGGPHPRQTRKFVLRHVCGDSTVFSSSFRISTLPQGPSLFSLFFSPPFQVLLWGKNFRKDKIHTYKWWTAEERLSALALPEVATFLLGRKQ